ncbi:sulfotransferase [Azorhizobium oxalatiphilum]|uniref:Sulfotransferase n=1 Tax=Azorhizobium oxalatiphilum TaxID=980631 RepID=A0A917C712_9HYPH|nr:tetratricopeptide repeat-containing sulfotransferase family protein [Azorhizobium oxalatiphilum]GGF75201.1 sulfotransferase [Azorhizobium oxalatiphilum]
MDSRQGTDAPAQITIQEAIQRASQHWAAGQAAPAEQLCQRVLAVWPGQPDALHILGLMAHAYGDLDLAIRYLREAANAPRVPAPYLSNLGEILRQKGYLAEAEEVCRRALALEPGAIGAWNNLGIILQEAGKLTESVACLERVAAAQPDSPQAFNNLANTCTRLGALETARTHYARALELDPDYAEAESNLSFLLNEMGRADEAARHARHAIDLDPQLADAYVNLAGAELGRQRPLEAQRWLEALLAFAPAHLGGLVAFARVLKSRQPDAALSMAQRAVATAPWSADARNVRGEILHALGRHAEARTDYRAAAEAQGAVRDTALANEAALLMELGETAEAGTTLAAILARDPRHVTAFAGQTQLKTFAPEDPDLLRMERLLASGEIQGFSERMTLHFALAKAWFDAGRADVAFAHLAQGNRMKRSTFDFDLAATGRWMREFGAVMGARLAEGPTEGGDPSTLPIFIVGMPRSGTTLLEQILASHPLVHGAGELPVMERLVSALPGYPASVAQMPPDQLTAMGRAYVEHVTALSAGRPHVVDKMPGNFLHVGLIRLMLPQARIIHSRRDAVDTCLSCYAQLFSAEQTFAYDLAELGGFYRQYEALMAVWRDALPASHFIEMDYERLVADQEGETRRLLDRLGLPWDARCLDFHRTQRPVRTASLVQVREPVHGRAVGRWRQHADHLQPLLEALEQTAP